MIQSLRVVIADLSMVLMTEWYSDLAGIEGSLEIAESLGCDDWLHGLTYDTVINRIKQEAS